MWFAGVVLQSVGQNDPRGVVCVVLVLPMKFKFALHQRRGCAAKLRFFVRNRNASALPQLDGLLAWDQDDPLSATSAVAA